MRAMLADRTAPIAERPLTAVEIERPVPRPDELLIRVSVCAVCRTDLHVLEGDLAPGKLPIVPGHQVVGVVEQAGPECSRFRPGDRVGIAWLRHTCGSCADCRRGSENLCAGSRYTGYHADGGYAEFTVVAEEFAYAIPDAFSDEEAAPLLCAGIIGFRALSRAEVPPNGRLGLYGFGSSAHVVLQLARHRGCAVYVATRREGHRALARRMGANWAGGPHDRVPEPLDGAIVFAPAGEVVLPALESVRPGGTVALAGIHMSDIPALDYERHLFHEKSLRSVEANTREDGRALLEEAARVPLRPEVTTYPLERANDALIDLKHGRIDGSAILRVQS
ncbi:MAG: zinc-dependent alcohol dehydrogenase family protein [bacterium]|nr:zinc-dependent alcohol dehydrogenase family protein [bacterium]